MRNWGFSYVVEFLRSLKIVTWSGPPRGIWARQGPIFYPKFFLTGWFSYNRVQKNWNEVFFKILEEPSIVQKKMIPHINGLGFSLIWSKKKFKMADLENSKWPPQKNLIFQLRQFSIFFHEIPMDRSLG